MLNSAKISKEQQSGELDVWATDLHNPDFSEFATGCGALGLKGHKKRGAGREDETNHWL